MTYSGVATSSPQFVIESFSRLVRAAKDGRTDLLRVPSVWRSSVTRVVVADRREMTEFASSVRSEADFVQRKRWRM